MNPESLIVMANRIAQFFEAMPDHAEAVDGVAQHLRKFWDPRMRDELQRLADAPALHPLVREALASGGVTAAQRP